MNLNTDVEFVNDHRPSSTDTGKSVALKTHPKRPSSFLSVRPVLGWWQTLLDLHDRRVEAMETHHQGQPRCTTATHPSTWEEGHLELEHSNEVPGLDVVDGDNVLAVTPHLILLDVFPGALVKMLLQVRIFVSDRGDHGPHSVSEADRWPGFGSKPKCRIVASGMNHGRCGVYLFEI